MDFNSEANRQVLISYFPHLGSDQHYKLLSEQTPVYNCIAWAMGFNDRWVDILMSPGHWWPEGVKRDVSPHVLVEAFAAVGFVESDNARIEDGFDKVALYQRNGEWVHASRIESNEVEYSKFGGSFDGMHSHNIFSGSIYGEEYAYMKRPISKRGLEGKLPEGKIMVNLANLTI